MMKNKNVMIKLLITITVVGLIINIYNSINFNSLGAGNPITNPNSWSPDIEGIDDEGTFSVTINGFIYITRILGTSISIITLAIIGVKYMLGSVEEKAEYKKSLYPYLIGAIFVFATSSIIGIIQEFTEILG